MPCNPGSERLPDVLPDLAVVGEGARLAGMTGREGEDSKR
jgi:hypothetical protein